jgi:UrcA family protein
MRISCQALLGLVLTGALIANSAPTVARPAIRRSLDPAVTVHFADLNLNSAAGTRTLYGRIRGAAQTVCGPSFSLWDGGHMAAWKECYRTTIDEAVTRINRPTLTALHLRMGTAKPG